MTFAEDQFTQKLDRCLYDSLVKFGKLLICYFLLIFEYYIYMYYVSWNYLCSIHNAVENILYSQLHSIALI